MAEDLSLNGPDNEDTQKDKYLTFHLAGENYGIDICYVIEIIGIQSITEVPDMPAFIRGVINLRGKVIPVMDVRARFKLPARDYDDRTCIIVINVDSTEVGLVVDEVSEVADIPESHVEPAPRTSKNSDNSYIQGMGKMNNRVIILLDVHKLLFSNEMQRLIQSDGDEE
ncbi:chemotaxis protein CheW [Pelovirga terrestris]|uniref:Chemotaxis protein CheW n=1 Tax=Pelovirga terrestris TaxID=2771352 RepID=A0A8J6QZT3_9BACT|nr:chemotaxis protein CheW [Pelovirga terrestris]MBD1401592.1 purine-binding chemotaxis protein CheW [Pelovirga terrestris]